MKLITKEIREKLIRNAQAPDPYDLKPVVKFFTPSANATWLIVSMVEHEDDTYLFGLCDLGLGFPETGDVSLNELIDLGKHTPFRMPVERDLYWEGKKTLREYTEEAHRAQRIVS